MRRSLAVINAERARAREKRARLEEEARHWEERAAANPQNAGTLEKLENVNRGLEVAEEELRRLDDEARGELLDGMQAGRYDSQSATVGLEPTGDRAQAPAHVLAAREQGLRAIARYDGTLSPAAADALDELVRQRDPQGLAGRYLDAVANPAYFTAFGRMIADPTSAHLRFSPEEVEAIRRVSQVEAERGMVEGTGSAGGFAVPFQLDPTLLLTSDGALNPIRQVARQITVTTNKWKGVSTASVIGGYQAEAAEAADGTPTLTQPEVDVFMGRAFVPFSIELQDDWAGLAQELGRLIADGRDQVDATKFLTGDGSDEPEGVLTGLTASQEVLTAGVGVYAVGDPWTFKAAIPARYAPRTSFLANPSIWDLTYRLVGTADSEEPVQMEGRGGPFLGRPKYEWSAMASTVASGNVLIVGGDFEAGYVICDRLGMQVEIVPHLFGASRRPTGERGIFARWRSGAAVVDANALRYLEVNAS